MRKTLLLIPVIATIALAGCSWGIKLTNAGRQVRTDWNGDMSACRQLGKVTVSVADHLGPIDRNPIKVRDELEVMARNEAADMPGADTVHPLTDPADGAQPWGVYQCGATSPTQRPAAAAPTSSQNGGAQTFPVDSSGH